MLRGDFAFVMINQTYKTNTKFTFDTLVARDAIGIVPLYYAYDQGEIVEPAIDDLIVKSLNPNKRTPFKKEIAFASELKAFGNNFTTIKPFPPGHYFSGEFDSHGEPIIIPYYMPIWNSTPHMNVFQELRNRLTEAVRVRLMSDVPYAVLLSGGLDSSLVAAITTRILKSRGVTIPLKTFSISVKGSNSSDKIAAQQVADFIGSNHYHFEFTIEEGIHHLETIIYHLETYDITTIRASTPMSLLARRIKSLGIKMVLSGEGSDEIFGGYLYFHKAPSAKALRAETIRRVKNLHLSDCLRANKSTMAWGVEARVPFLDTSFLSYAMCIDENLLVVKPEQNMEKWVLRKTFEQGEYLPYHLLWRQKEQFSDGVGYSWIDSLKAHTESQVSDVEFSTASSLYPINTPTTKEGFYYRKIFERRFCQAAIPTVVPWVPLWSTNTDPSGRAQAVHEAALKD
jgi:asparagine synthase (glutamine-hydrolysing)